MDFVIDITGEINNEELFTNANESHGASSVATQLLKDLKTSLNAKSKGQKPAPIKLSEDELVTKEILKDLGWTDKLKPHLSKYTKKRKSKNLENNVIKSEAKKEARSALEKSAVLQPDFEKLHEVPQYDVSQRKMQIERKKEREKTKGKKWYGLPAPEMTEEVKRDLEIVQMRSVLDPKRFYKKNDMNVLPKYFQIGTVMDSPIEFYNNRLTKKERKKTLVDELMADAEFSKYNKRKYKQIIDEKQKTHYKAWRQAKRLKKRK